MREYEPKCVLCNNGRTLFLTGHILCKFEGPVTTGYCCKKFEMNYLKLKPRRLPVKKKQFSAEDFSLD